MNSWKAISTLVLAALCAGETAAWAADCTFTNGSSDGTWETAGNWSCGIAPTASDRVIIPTGTTCTVTGATAVADQVRVEGTGVLNINASSKLTLDGSNACEVNASGSEIRLLGSGAELAFISTTDIFGSGKIVGQNAAAKISAATSTTLTSSSIIEGTLLIDGAGGFANHGRVEANNADDPLVVQMTGAVDDNAGNDRWKVSASGATLEFSSAIGTLASMQGECAVSAGTLLVNEALTTTGRLEISGGTLQANQNTTMGDDTTNFLSMTGGNVVVPITKTFTHY